MKDRAKKVLKRGASGLLAVLLAVCLVGTPRAKAVVSEGALLGSIFGSLLVSMGYSWAADNMDVPTFGESIYKLIQECDEEMDTGIQLLMDANLAGVTAAGPGRARFTQQWVKLARSFAEWFQGKYFIDSSDVSSVVSQSSPYGSVKLANGGVFSLSKYVSMESEPLGGTVIRAGDSVPFSTGYVFQAVTMDSGRVALELIDTDGKNQMGANYEAGTQIWLCLDSNHKVQIYTHQPSQRYYFNSVSLRSDSYELASDYSLTAEKPQEIHYPDVAEDGSQVYEITVDGVTATDIEGIIQGAVDRILAGTAAIAGSIADVQAGTGEEVANPEIDPYKVGLSSVFPFCIPFDVYNMVTMFVADPEAPHAEWTFSLPWGSQEYSVGWDLSAFDGVARVCRDMELVLFAVGLAVITYKVIKW